MDSNRLVCIRTFRDLPQGELARSLLMHEGFAVYLADEFIVGLNWLYSQAVGGVSLWVAESDARRALDLLAEDRTHVLLLELGLTERDIEVCRSCGSTDLAYRSRRVGLAAWVGLLNTPLFFLGTVLFLLWLGTGAWILTRPRWRCGECGTTFREL